MEPVIPIIIVLGLLAGAGFMIADNVGLLASEEVEAPKTSNSDRSSGSSGGGGSGGGGSNKPARTVPTYVPLTDEEKNLIISTAESSEFVAKIPSKYPISLKFFYFEEGYRVWQDELYLADGSVLESGEALVFLTLHSKYLDNIREGSTICDMVKEANANGDLGFWTEESEASLGWKYKGLISYRECFGF